MKKLITLLTTLFLLSIFAVTSFAEENVKVRMIQNFDENTTAAFYEYRDEIIEASFLDSVEGISKDAKVWNIGIPSGDSVTAWIELDEEATAEAKADRYRLYIGAEGPYKANSNMSHFFENFVNLKKVSGLGKMDTSNLTNLEYMFSGCFNLESVDLDGVDTSDVIRMNRMFYKCHKLKVLDLSSFTAESLESMHYMFGDCYELTKIYVSKDWKISDKVTGYETFINCTSLSGEISYDKNKVSCKYATTKGYMTDEANADVDENPEVKPDLNLDKTIKSYSIGTDEDFNLYRNDIVSVTFKDNKDILGAYKQWDVSVKGDSSVMAWLIINTEETIKDSIGNPITYRYDLYIGGNDGVNANPDSSYMFYEYKNLKEINGLQNFNTAQTTDMGYMFYRCNALTNVDISTLNTANVKNMSYMFGFCYALRKVNLSNLDTSNVTDINNMFYYSTSLEEIDLSGLDLSKIEKVPSFFNECPVKRIKADGIILCDNVKDIFKNKYEGKSTLEEISLTNADLSNLFNMSRMFENCDSLVSVDLTSLDLSKVKDMSYMFSDCDNLLYVYFGETDALDVMDMSYMFYNCANLRVAEFKDFATGSIRNMAYMFCNCQTIQSLNFGKFNTALLQNLDQTFRNCTDLRKIYVGEKWSIKAVASGNGTFKGCENLAGSVAYADVKDVTHKAATLNGYLTPVDDTVKIPPVEKEEEDNVEETKKLNIFERIIEWFKKIFERFFGKKN